MEDFRYNSFVDAQQHLDHCLVMTDDNRPVYLSYSDKWNYQVKYLDKLEDTSIKDIRDINLTFKPLKLGYINSAHGLLYIIRDAKRMWKAGLTHQNMYATYGYVPKDIHLSMSLRNCLTNNYPSMQKAYSRAVLHAEETAFDRDFAFTTNDFPKINLSYKGIVIGNVDRDLNIEVISKYKYVSEALQEIIHAQN